MLFYSQTVAKFLLIKMQTVDDVDLIDLFKQIWYICIESQKLALILERKGRQTFLNVSGCPCFPTTILNTCRTLGTKLILDGRVIEEAKKTCSPSIAFESSSAIKRFCLRMKLRKIQPPQKIESNILRTIALDGSPIGRNKMPIVSATSRMLKEI